MSLISRISDLTLRLATEFKAVKSKISGNNSGDLTANPGLSTTAKTSLVVAINETVSNIATINNSKGAANGIATLGSDGKVPAGQLPSYVDDVLEVANLAALPVTGASGVIYVTADTNITYRWSGTVYVEISASLALGETSSTAYRGDRGKTAYDHSQLVAGTNPHATTFASLGAKPTTISGFGITDAYTKTEVGSTIETNYVTAFEAAL